MERVNLEEYREELEKMSDFDLEVEMVGIENLLAKSFVEKPTLELAKMIYATRKINKINNATN